MAGSAAVAADLDFEAGPWIGVAWRRYHISAAAAKRRSSRVQLFPDYLLPLALALPFADFSRPKIWDHRELYASTHGTTELHGRLAYPAGGAKDQHRFARLQPAALPQRKPCRVVDQA